MKKTNKIKWIIMIVLSIAISSCKPFQKQKFQNVDELIAFVSPRVSEISAEDLHQRLENGEILIIIDIRESDEFNPGYIPGAVNIPRGLLEFNILKDEFWENQFLYPPLKTDKIILYCKKGHRSILAAATLQQLGFENVKYLKDGFKAWELTYPQEQLKNLDEVHHETTSGGGC